MSEEGISKFSLFSIKVSFLCLTCLTRQGVLPRRGFREESRSGASRAGAEGRTLYKVCHFGDVDDDHDIAEYYYYIDGDYNHEGERINDPRPDPCFVCTVCTHCCKEKMDALYSTPCNIFCSKISTKPALSNYTHIVCRPMYNKGHRLNRFQTCYEFYKNAKPHP